MYVAGLTGSIATGKSTVSAMLEALGARVVDADRIAREVVAPGMPAWERIVEEFGREILLPTGELDRVLLGRIVFPDRVRRSLLESIVHPEVVRVIGERVQAMARELPGSPVILDVPLLIEAGLHEGLGDVIVVYCPEETQILRLMERDAISREEALARIRAQMPIEEKRRLASIVVDNSGGLGETRKRVEGLYRILREKARGAAS